MVVKYDVGEKVYSSKYKTLLKRENIKRNSSTKFLKLKFIIFL